MDGNEALISFRHIGWHKGFYKEENITDALCSVLYENFLEVPEDEEFPYFSAGQLLRGSCHHFVLGLEKVLGYTPYIIEGKNRKSFHAFCQIYKGGLWFYVDARGVTTSFDEFMDVAKEFVSDEYIIRPVEANDLTEWKKDDKYFDIATAFAVAVIEKYKHYYTL